MKVATKPGKSSEKTLKSILECRSIPIEYTERQTIALEDIAEIIDRGSGYYLLAGYAGTGKTTIAENIAKYARQSRKEIVILAPTNKAAKVLADKIRNTGLSVSPTTIHKAIYGAPHPVTGEWIRGNTIMNSVIIVDESSMISKGLMEDLLLNTRVNNVIIFMGDSFQLEPVGEDCGLFKGRVHQIQDQIELIEVKRQSLESNILKIATLCRTDNKGYVPEQSYPDFKLHSKYREFIEDYKSSIRNNENSVLIVATNQERLTMNAIARTEKFGSDLPDIQPQETLIAVANSDIFPNSEVFTVLETTRLLPTQKIVIEIGGAYKKYDIDVYYIQVQNPDGSGIIDKRIIHIPNLDKPSLYHAQMVKPILLNYELKNSFEEYIRYDKKGQPKLSPEVVITTFGYSITAHKSQGSQWEKVYVNQNYSAPSWNASRWYYTAITRSSKDVVVLPTQYQSITDLTKF